MAKSMLYVLQLAELLGSNHPKVAAARAEVQRSLNINIGAVIKTDEANHKSPAVRLSSGNDHRRICHGKDGKTYFGATARRRLEEGLSKRK